MLPRSLVIFGTIGVVSLECLLGAAHAANRKPVSWQPSKLVPGSPILFQVPATKSVQNVAGQWLGHDIAFSRPSDGSTWYGIAGISLETTPGRYELRLTQTLAHGRTIQIRRQITIARAVYPRVPVKVAKQFTE